MNQVTMIGRLCRPITIKRFDTGSRVTNNTLAVQRNHKDQTGDYVTDFIPIASWNGQADFLESYGEKGQQIAIIGRMQSRDYQDQDGQKHYVIECVTDEIKLLARPRRESEDSQEIGAITEEFVVNEAEIKQAMNMELAD